MEYIALVLLFIGAISLFVELFIPGFGFFGVFGVILLIISGTITVLCVPLGPIILCTEIVMIGVIGYLIAEYVKRHGVKGGIIMTDTLEEDKNNEAFLSTLVGKEGLAKTPLKPCGNIEIDGEKIEAYSDGDYILPGDNVIAVRVCDNKLYVKKTKN